MPPNLSLRLLLILLAVCLPPLLAFGAVLAFRADVVLGVGRGTLLLVVTLFAVAWTGAITLVTSRSLGRELVGLVDLAARGGAEAGEEGAPRSSVAELSAAQRRLTALLAERDRQIQTLAEESAAVPITDEPAAVARRVARAARLVTRDATWSLVVLDSGHEPLIPGVYGAGDEEDREPLGELHRWASVVGGDAAGTRAGRAEGPWGSFVIVDVATTDQLRAFLMAPWEGRVDPPPAELTLFSLVGQHAAAALEHALLYARLRSQTDELNRLAAVQADFLRGVTHDLQTPLTSIGALASELQADRSVPTSFKAQLDTIAFQAQRLHRMVSQLLTMSRLEAGVLRPATEVFRAEPIVRRVWDSLRAGQPFEVESSGPDRLAIGDPDRLEQALWAVLDNAVKYSAPDSRIRVSLEALPSDRDGRGATLTERIEIRDEGIGMDPASREQALEQFYRSDEARRRVPDGSGIGLYTASQLMRLMGGSLAVESRLGEGTTVRLELPAEVTDEQPRLGD